MGIVGWHIQAWLYTLALTLHAKTHTTRLRQAGEGHDYISLFKGYKLANPNSQSTTNFTAMRDALNWPPKTPGISWSWQSNLLAQPSQGRGPRGTTSCRGLATAVAASGPRCPGRCWKLGMMLTCLWLLSTLQSWTTGWHPLLRSFKWDGYGCIIINRRESFKRPQSPSRKWDDHMDQNPVEDHYTNFDQAPSASAQRVEARCRWPDQQKMTPRKA